jgi:multiple sugar transport system substrate-binding protein
LTSVLPAAAAASTRRTLLTVLAGAAGAGVMGVLGACAPGAAQPAPEKELTQPVTLEYWPHWNSTTNAKGYAALADAFTAENPKITINTTSTGNNVEKLLSAVVAGTPPDATIIRGHGQSLAIKAALQNLDDRIAKARHFKKGDYSEAQWEQYTWKGKIHALPSAENGARGALAYNKKLFAEAGLNPAQPPKTIDELTRVHERLTKEEEGKIKQLGFDPWDAMGLEGFLELWCQGAYGVKWYDPQKLKLSLNGPDMIQAVEQFASYRIRLGWDKVAAFRSVYPTWFNKTSGITVGAQAIQIDGYWNPGSIRLNAAPDSDVPANMTYAWIPTRRGTEKVQMSGGWAAAMPTGVKNADAAWRWMDWLATAKANQILVDNFGFINGNKSILKDLKYDHTPQLKFYLDSMTQADRVIPHVNLPIWTDLDKGYRAGLNDVGQQKKSAKAMLDDLQTQLQQLLDDVTKGT